MRKTATKMLLLGVAVLALFGAAMTIKNSYATEGAAPAATVQITPLTDEQRTELNEKAGEWLAELKNSLEAKDDSLEDRNVAALGESASVAARHSVNLAPWVIIILAFVGGASLLFVAFNKQYQPATREDVVSKMVDKIVARSASRTQSSKPSRQRSKARVARQKAQQPGEFDDISRAVDEIVAKYQQKD